MEVLQAYLDGEVDAATARRIAVHLDRCTPCENESDVYERIKVSLSHRRSEIDPDVAAALDEFIQQLMRDDADGV
jgi:anti-sigma factor RsiW